MIVFLQLHTSAVDREVHRSKHKMTPFLFEAGRPRGVFVRTHCAYANFDRARSGARARAHINVRVHGLVYTHAVNVHVYVCAQLHNLFFYGALPQTEKNEWNKCKNHLSK